jgi:deoxyribonucleoside regulator
MKNPLSRSDLLLRIAKLHYDEDLSKTAIADKLGMSATHVGRLLDAARNTGVVKIQFSGPRNESLARSLVKRYPCLREAFVIGTEHDYLLQTRTLAKTAAEYFDDYLSSRRSNVKVGLSGGQTVFEFVKALPERRRNITLYPTAILGRGGTIVKHVDPIVSLMVLWGKSGYRKDGLFFVTVTPPENIGDGHSSADVRRELDILRNKEAVSHVYTSMSEVDVIFASLRQMGMPDKSTQRMGITAMDLVRDLGVRQEDLKDAVGDLNYSFIDKRGLTRSEWRFFLSLQADELRNIAKDPSKRVVIVAGRHKQRILHAALRGRLLNVLITDEVTAEGLVDDGNS